MKKILIVDDEHNIVECLDMNLRKKGYATAFAYDGTEAVLAARRERPDCILLDVMLPKISGIEVCHLLKADEITGNIPVIMLTAKGENESEVTGLSCGADDYLRKPFDIQVLLLRIKKLCNAADVLQFHEIRLNPVTMEVTKDHKKMVLTKTEFELLKYFLSNQNIVLSREQLLNHVWGMDFEGDPRTVDTNIRRLRKKIGEDLIQTRIGMGYMMGGSHD